MQKSMHRRLSSDTSALSSSKSLQEKRVPKNSDLQIQILQLQNELKKERDEKARAFEDLEELRSSKKFIAFSNKEEMEALEKKVQQAKASERKMMESLMDQTEQLEQAKLSLEAARLELKILKENTEKKQNPTDTIQYLINELDLATTAEGKSKKAMDDLVNALKEVTMEKNQVKATLSTTQLELEKLKLEFEQSKELVDITNEKLRSTIEESERYKLEHEEMVAKLKTYEDEIAELKLEIYKSNDVLEGSRDETSKLRDILKQAINEATMVKEALDIARKENSLLNGLLCEKDIALECLKQGIECNVEESKEHAYMINPTTSIFSKEERSLVKEVNDIKDGVQFLSDRYPNNDSRVPKAKEFGFVRAESMPTSSVYDEENECDNNEDRSQSIKMKMTAMQRIGDMVRMRSFHKQS